MKAKVRNVLLIVFAAICIIYPVYTLIVRSGFLHWQYTANGFFHSPSGKLMVEVVIWFVIALVGIKWCNVRWLIGVTLVFVYAHVMLLPLLLAIFYCIFTVLVGMFLMRCIPMYRENKQCLLASYFVGIMALTILYAVLSLLKIGSIQNIKLIDSVLFIILSIWFCRSNIDKVRLWIRKCYQGYNVSNAMYFKLMMVMCFLMISIGRANISLEWDSTWYGVRSQYVLDNVSGIYDNLKMIGCVFLYPKGYETYVLPLNWNDSFTFVYAGNIVFGIWILYAAYKICRLFLDSEQSLWGVVLISAIPGIMNMTITAKPDIMTLFVQLITIYYSLLFLSEKKAFYLELVLASYIFAQTLKTTAVIFSTSILLALLFVGIAYNIVPCLKQFSFAIFSLSIIDVGFIWYRTYLFTGIPATSVWGKFFRFLGMKDKYPYNSGQISQFRNGNLFDMTIVKATILRIMEFLFAPNSSDADHIIIAWGTTLCTFMIILMIVGSIWNMKDLFSLMRSKAEVCFSGLLVIGEFLGCLMSLWIGVKPDGNYFMLYYSVTIIFGIIFVLKILLKDVSVSKSLFMGILMVFLPVNMMFSGAVNWAWASSFNKIDWINKGYYNHRQDFKDEMSQRGCVAIYDIMSSDSSNKVYALAEHPFIEQVPCVIESDTSVSAWGNAELTSSNESFIQFVEFSDFDYIYIAPEFVKKDSQAYENLFCLFQEDMISSLLIENGHMLLKMGKTEDADLREEMKMQFLEMF